VQRIVNTKFKGLIIFALTFIVSYTSYSTYARADTINVDIIKTSSTNSFPSTILYDDDVRSGTLSKNGSSYISSGVYTPANTKYVAMPLPDIQKTDYALWTGTGWVVQYTIPDIKALQTPYNQDGYVGTLDRFNIAVTDAYYCYSGPASRVVGDIYQHYTYTCHYENQGYVTKPASDTRKYSQKYSGLCTTIDNSLPVATSGYISGADYINGSDYWVKPGSTINFWTQAYDSEKTD
jgi:hypothetical protein